MTNVGSFSSSFAVNTSGELATGVASLDPPLLQQTKSEIRNLTLRSRVLPIRPFRSPSSAMAFSRA